MHFKNYYCHGAGYNFQMKLLLLYFKLLFLFFVGGRGKVLVHNIFLKTPAASGMPSLKIAQYVGVFVKLIV